MAEGGRCVGVVRPVGGGGPGRAPAPCAESIGAEAAACAAAPVFASSAAAGRCTDWSCESRWSARCGPSGSIVVDRTRSPSTCCSVISAPAPLCASAPVTASAADAGRCKDWSCKAHWSAMCGSSGTIATDCVRSLPTCCGIACVLAPLFASAPISASRAAWCCTDCIAGRSRMLEARLAGHEEAADGADDGSHVTRRVALTKERTAAEDDAEESDSCPGIVARYVCM